MEKKKKMGRNDPDQIQGPVLSRKHLARYILKKAFKAEITPYSITINTDDDGKDVEKLIKIAFGS